MFNHRVIYWYWLFDYGLFMVIVTVDKDQGYVNVSALNGIDHVNLYYDGRMSGTFNGKIFVDEDSIEAQELVLNTLERLMKKCRKVYHHTVERNGR